MSSGSAMIPPAVIRGSRLAYGSWKIICIRLRRRRNSAPLNSVTSWPSKMMRPPVGGLSRMIARPVVLLPQPDSPTRPRVSPRSISNVTPSTAWTSPTWRWRMIPSRIGNQTFRPSSRRSGTLPAAAVAPVEVIRPASVVMEDPAFAVVLGLGWDRQPAGRGPERERPLLGLDIGDHALQVGGRADPSRPDLVDHAGRRRGRHEAWAQRLAGSRLLLGRGVEAGDLMGRPGAGHDHARAFDGRS